MSVDAISFSAHADFPQTSEFIAALQPPHVVFVHGEATNMQRLRDALAAQVRRNGLTAVICEQQTCQVITMFDNFPKSFPMARTSGLLDSESSCCICHLGLLQRPTPADRLELCFPESGVAHKSKGKGTGSVLPLHMH